MLFTFISYVWAISEKDVFITVGLSASSTYKGKLFKRGRKMQVNFSAALGI